MPCMKFHKEMECRTPDTVLVIRLLGQQIKGSLADMLLAGYQYLSHKSVACNDTETAVSQLTTPTIMFGSGIWMALTTCSADM